MKGCCIFITPTGGAILCWAGGGLIVPSMGRPPGMYGSRNVVPSADIPSGEPESSGGEGFEDDPAGDSCPLSDGLNSFVLQSHTRQSKFQLLELHSKVQPMQLLTAAKKVLASFK